MAVFSNAIRGDLGVRGVSTHSVERITGAGNVHWHIGSLRPAPPRAGPVIGGRNVDVEAADRHLSPYSIRIHLTQANEATAVLIIPVS